MFEVDVFLILCQVLVAVLGTAARWLSIKEKEKSLIAEVVVAAFAATLVYAFFTWQSINVYISFLVSGGIGYQGTKGLDVLLKMIAKKAGWMLRRRSPEKLNPAVRSTEKICNNTMKSECFNLLMLQMHYKITRNPLNMRLGNLCPFAVYKGCVNNAIGSDLLKNDK